MVWRLARGTFASRPTVATSGARRRYWTDQHVRPRAVSRSIGARVPKQRRRCGAVVADIEAACTHSAIVRSMWSGSNLWSIRHDAARGGGKRRRAVDPARGTFVLIQRTFDTPGEAIRGLHA